jgi:hypothetical protein
MKKKSSLEKIKDLKIMYGLTMVLVPTIVMAISSQYITNALVRPIAQVLLLFLQAIIVHGMLQNRYSE